MLLVCWTPELHFRDARQYALVDGNYAVIGHHLDPRGITLVADLLAQALKGRSSRVKEH